MSTATNGPPEYIPGHSLCAYRGQILKIGGQFRTEKVDYPSCDSVFYDPTNNTWRSTLQNPAQILNLRMKLFICNDLLYVVKNSTGTATRECRLERFDGGTQMFSSVVNMIRCILILRYRYR